VDNEYIQVFYNKIYFIIFPVFTQMLERATHVLVWYRCTYMLDLLKKKHVTIQSEGYSWWIPYRWEVTFGPFCICYHNFSLQNKPAVYKPAVKLCLEMEATSQWIAFHCWSLEWILRNPLRFCQHTQHFSWQ